EQEAAPSIPSPPPCLAALTTLLAQAPVLSRSRTESPKSPPGTLSGASLAGSPAQRKGVGVMVQVSYPGVYIVEKASGVRTITGVATSIAAFVGYTRKGVPDKAVAITSFADFERCYGGLDRDSPLSYGVRQFFLNGGTQALIVRVAVGH